MYIHKRLCIYIYRKSPTLSLAIVLSIVLTLSYIVPSYLNGNSTIEENKRLAFCLPCLPTDSTARTVREVSPFTCIHCYNKFLTRKCSSLFSGEKITDPVILQLKEGPSCSCFSITLGNVSESRSKKVAGVLLSQRFCPVSPTEDGHCAFLCCSHNLQPLHWPNYSASLHLELMITVKINQNPVWVSHGWTIRLWVAAKPSVRAGCPPHLYVQNLSLVADLHGVCSTGGFTLHLQSPAQAHRWLTEDRQKEANISTLPSVHSFLFLTANTTF